MAGHIGNWVLFCSLPVTCASASPFSAVLPDGRCETTLLVSVTGCQAHMRQRLLHAG